MELLAHAKKHLIGLLLVGLIWMKAKLPAPMCFTVCIGRRDR